MSGGVPSGFLKILLGSSYVICIYVKNERWFSVGVPQDVLRSIVCDMHICKKNERWFSVGVPQDILRCIVCDMHICKK